MIPYNVHETKTRLAKLLLRVMRRVHIIIAEAGKRVAILSPFSDVPANRVPGKDAGKIVIKSNFNDPLPEFEEYT